MPNPNHMSNLKNERTLNAIALVFSVLVFVLVAMMRQYKFDIGLDLSFLPAFHAMLNALAAVCLITAYGQIKQGRVIPHRQWMKTAMVLSGTFLLSYVLYHFTQEQATYGGEGIIKSVYLFILTTHIVLAGAILPFILFTFIRAYLGDYDRHRKMAIWVYPIWLYVSLTGPLVYLFMMPYY